MEKRISISDLEKAMNTKYLCTKLIRIKDEVLGDNEVHSLEFDIFDGFAYCHNYKGNEYFMEYPRKDFVNKNAKSMAKSVREYLKLDSDAEINEIHLLQSYNVLSVNK